MKSPASGYTFNVSSKCRPSSPRDMRLFASRSPLVPPMFTRPLLSVNLSDSGLSHRGYGLAALLSAILRIFIFSSPVDSTQLCSSTFVLWLGTQLRLGLRMPFASTRACSQSLRFHTYLFSAASPPWPIVATPWLPLLAPRMPHTHCLARLAALSGAVYSAHSQIPTPSTSALTGCE
jgi:hypothetical protein